MTTPSDPILRALREGDEACPDGRALAALGRLAREGARLPGPVDLVDRVRADCAAIDLDQAEAEMIDELYDGDRATAAAADPTLARLGELVRTGAAPEREVDLLPRLEGKLTRLSSRRAAAADLDGSTRWRIWTMVIAGHVAALLTLAVFNIQMADRAQPRTGIGGPELSGLYAIDVGSLTTRHAAPQELELAPTWLALADRPQQVLALRAQRPLRDQARERYGMSDSAGTATAATAWLVARLRNQSGTIGTLTGEVEHDVAVQSLAALALLGQGSDDPVTRASAARVLEWLLVQQPRVAVHDVTVGGLLALALVEGALQHERSDLRAAAEAQLAGIATGGEFGRARGGALLLACELAATAGFALPDGLRARALAAGDIADAAVGRQLAEGVHAAMGDVPALLADRPVPDDAGRLDLLAWQMPTFAVRELGGLLWLQWAEDLQRSLLPAFRHSPDGEAWMPGELVRHAEITGPAADVFATSLALLTLQAPYRYLPLAH